MSKHNIIIRFPILILLIFVCVSNTYGNIDSLKQVWLNDAEADSSRFNAIDHYYLKYAYAHPDSVLSLSHYHFELARQKNIRVELAEALDTRALAYYLLGKSDSAISVLHQALDLVRKFDDPPGLARVYANLGNVYLSQNKYQEAVRYYSFSLDILNEHKIEFGKAEVLNNLGLLYHDIRQFDLSLQYFEEALDLYKKVGMEEETGNIWLNIGSVYFDQEDYIPAKSYGFKALNILQLNNHQVAIANTYFLLARIAQKTNQRDSAFHFVNESLKLNRQIGNQLSILKDLVLLAGLTMEKDIREATRMAEEIQESFTGIADHTLKMDTYELLYSCYKKQNDYPRALEMHENYSTYSDSVQKEKNNISIIREAIKNEFRVKLLKNQHEHEQAQAQLILKQTKERYFMVFAVIILLGSVLYYTRSRIRFHQRQKEGLLKEVERLKLAGNSPVSLQSGGFQLDRDKIEMSTERNLNETDWKVLNILLNDPVISNKAIAEQAFMSVDGIGSSLRRMYITFGIRESKYKKISLIMEAIKRSNS